MMPDRLVTRLASSLVVEWIKRLQPLHRGDMITLIVFAAVYDTTARWKGRPIAGSDAVLGQAPAPERTVTPYAIAASLGRPYKTIRRKINLLVERGLAVVSDDGVRVASNAVDCDLLREPARLIALAAVRLRRRFIELGLLEATEGRTFDRDVAALFGAANGFALQSLLTMNSGSGVSLNQTALFLATGHANTKHLGRGDHPPYRTYLDTIPNIERRPVTGLDLAEELALPRETTRRHLWALVSSGHLCHVRGGFIVNEQHLHTEGAQATATKIRTSVRRLLRTLQ